MSTHVDIDNLTVKYGKHIALHDVSGVFEAGSLTAVAGPNGSGKSSLLKVIAGVLKPSAGRVTIAQGPKSVAYLPQTATIRHDFPMNVEQAVATGFWAELGHVGAITEAKKQRVRAALEEVGLGGLEKRQIASLSGGQFQRMLFARVIVQDARLILLDEPFTAVDAETTARLIQILLKWHREGRTVICVLHDLLLISKYFPESLVLAGKCLGVGHTHKMFEQKLLSFDLDMAELCTEGDAHASTHHTHAHDHKGHSHDHS
jgi:zinc/manganese transport system ATP-binding protein